MIKCGAAWHQDTSPPHKPHIYITSMTMKLKHPFSFLLPTIIRFSSLDSSTQSKKKTLTQFCSNQNWCSVNVQFGFPPSLCNFHKHRVIWNSQRARQSAWIEWTLATSRQPQKISRSMHNGLVHLIFVFLLYFWIFVFQIWTLTNCRQPQKIPTLRDVNYCICLIFLPALHAVDSVFFTCELWNMENCHKKMQFQNF